MKKIHLYRYADVVFYALFFISAFILHYYGPLNGLFSFESALQTFLHELNIGLGWPLVLSACLICFFSEVSLRQRFWEIIKGKKTEDYAFSGLAVLVVLLLIPLPELLISKAAMVILLFSIGVCVPIGVLIKSFLLAIILYLSISYAFTILKAYVFLERESNDHYLVTIDHMLKLDVLSGYLTQMTHHSGLVTWMADKLYQLIFPIILMFGLSAAMYGKECLRHYGLSMALTYCFGAIIYILFPAWGPFVSDEFKAVATNWFSGGYRVAHIQLFIGENTARVASGNLDFNVISPFAFVAAMPSLHVATPAVAAFVLGKKSICLKIYAWLMVLVSAYAAIVTGMHYVIDLLVGILLAMFAVSIAGKYLKWVEQKSMSQSSLAGSYESNYS